METDYLIPNLKLTDTTEYHIGKYGRKVIAIQYSA